MTKASDLEVNIDVLDDDGPDEIGRFDEQNRQAADAWERLHALRTDSDIATDYVVVAEGRKDHGARQP